MGQLISTQEAARFLGITRPTVIKYIQDERLEAMRVGKIYKIGREALIKFAKKTGMPEDRLDSLDILLEQSRKKTNRLDPPDLDHLKRRDPPLPLSKESGVLYFLSFRLQGGPHEVLFQVTTPKFFIGRHSLASISIQDPYVSSMHATLLYEDRFVAILDQSTNGTQIGNQVLTHGETQLLGDGDQFMVGTTVFTVISAHRIDLYMSGAGAD